MLDQLILLRQVVLHVSVAEHFVLTNNHSVYDSSLINIEHKLVPTRSRRARDRLRTWLLLIGRNFVFRFDHRIESVRVCTFQSATAVLFEPSVGRLGAH